LSHTLTGYNASTLSNLVWMSIEQGKALCGRVWRRNSCRNRAVHSRESPGSMLCNSPGGF